MSQLGIHGVQRMGLDSIYGFPDIVLSLTDSTLDARIPWGQMYTTTMSFPPSLAVANAATASGSKLPENAEMELRDRRSVSNHALVGVQD
jgi:hypothetical protein